MKINSPLPPQNDALRRALTPPVEGERPRLPSNFNYKLMQRIGEVERERRRREHLTEIAIGVLLCVGAIVSLYFLIDFEAMGKSLWENFSFSFEIFSFDFSSPLLLVIPLCFVIFPIFSRMADKWIER